MAASLVLLLSSVLWLSSAAQGKELSVVCMASEDCALPCQFLSDGKGARIMWYKKKAVVSCTRYGNTSFVVGHNSPADKYLGRTGLYADQVLGGNATLLLRNVTPADQGKYICVTMTAPSTDESGVVSLIVKAPVRGVDIEFNDNEVVCRASSIFPAPTVEWSTDPPTDVGSTRTRNSSRKNKVGFYSIQSSLLFGRNPFTNQTQNVTFICSVSSEHNKRTAFLRHEETISVIPGSNVEIPCTLPTDVPQNFNLTWKFSRSDTIVTISVTDSRSEVKVWDQWKTHVFASLSAVKSLHVHRLTPQISGTYTCEVRTAEGDYVTWTEVTTQDLKENIYISVITVLAFVLLVSFAYRVYKDYQSRKLLAKPSMEMTVKEHSYGKECSTT